MLSGIELRVLFVPKTNITDVGIVAIAASCHHLTSVSVAGCAGVGDRSLEALGQVEAYRDRTIFICGGAEIYSQALGQCSDLFLTRVKREVEGDAFFPEFESLFDAGVVLRETDEFDIFHHRRLGQATAEAGGD